MFKALSDNLRYLIGATNLFAALKAFAPRSRA
jgi:hypothetical protein